MYSEASYLPSRNLQVYLFLNLVRFLAKPENIVQDHLAKSVSQKSRIPDLFHLETLAVPKIYTLVVDLKVLT